MCVKSLQLCPTLCNPMNWSPPGSSAQGILQAKILEWAAMPCSRGSSRPRDQGHVYFSCSGRRILYHWHHLGSLLTLARLHILCWIEVGRMESLPCFQSEKVKVAQSCPTVCDLMDYTVHGILLARILEWVAFPFSRRSCQLRDRAKVSHIAGRFFTTEKYLIIY